MPQPSLADLTAAAAKAEEPGFTPESPIRLGGVDPLGLRQINFDLMDQVFPGLNNVARHIRPFVVVAWACRRTEQLARDRGVDRVPVDDLLDFANRIEVIYAWSQILRTPDVELPGRQFLAHLLHFDRWIFGGPKWKNSATCGVTRQPSPPLLPAAPASRPLAGSRRTLNIRAFCSQ